MFSTSLLCLCESGRFKPDSDVHVCVNQARAKLDLREEVSEQDALDVVDVIKVNIEIDFIRFKSFVLCPLA
jgi:hypothetical protein